MRGWPLSLVLSRRRGNSPARPPRASTRGPCTVPEAPRSQRAAAAAESSAQAPQVPRPHMARPSPARPYLAAKRGWPSAWLRSFARLPAPQRREGRGGETKGREGRPRAPGWRSPGRRCGVRGQAASRAGASFPRRPEEDELLFPRCRLKLFPTGTQLQGPMAYPNPHPGRPRPPLALLVPPHAGDPWAETGLPASLQANAGHLPPGPLAWGSPSQREPGSWGRGPQLPRSNSAVAPAHAGSSRPSPALAWGVLCRCHPPPRVGAALPSSQVMTPLSNSASCQGSNYREG